MKIASLTAVVTPYKGLLEERFSGHWARISTNGSLRLRSTAQDVSRVIHGEVLPEVFRLTKGFPKPPQGIHDFDFVFGYKDADGNEVKGALETDKNLQEYVSKFPKEWEIVVKSLGLSKSRGQHACGMVIVNEPLQNFIPTEVLSDGTRVTSFVNSTEDPSIEDSGALKYDFLQLKTLRDIQGCIKLVQQKNGYESKDERIKGLRVPGLRVVPHLRNGAIDLYDIWDMPEDQDVFKDICMGGTTTVFQFSTPAAKQWLSKFYHNGKHYLRSVEHLSAFTALDRPGPLDAKVQEGDISRNILEEFAARSQGQKPIGNIPALDSMLAKTFGLIVYQEDLQRVFQEIGQTTAEQGDEFRVHVSKKKMAEVYKDKAIFMPGATKILGESEANRLWNLLETFGKYGFNLSHSTAYAIIAYACAWLKHHYPLEWWTSCLCNADRNDIDQKFWVHCSKYIRVPDVRLSQDNFAVEDDGIRAPLRLLSGVGEKAHEELVAGRPYKDIRDFVQRIYDHKVATGSVVEKKVKKNIPKKQRVEGGPTFTEEKVKEMKLGRSSLNTTVLLKLIVSGTADSLFPPETKSMFDKLTMFANIWAEVYNLRRKDGSLKVEQVDPRFGNLTSLQHFLLKKSILPSYAANLAEMVSVVRDDIIKQGNKYAWKAPRAFEGNQYIPIVPGDIAKAILDGEHPDGADVLPKFKFGVVGYVNNVESFWNGKALRVSFEVDGERMDAVMWPQTVEDEDGVKQKVPPKVPTNFKGSVAILTLARWRTDGTFSLNDTVVVEGPFNLKSEDE